MDDLTREMIAEARKDKTALRSGGMSMMGNRMMARIGLDRVERVEIVQEGERFWGNVVFTSPDFEPNVLGTPDRHPRFSREEALGDVRGILILAKQAEMMRGVGPRAEDDEAIFEIDNVALVFNRNALKIIPLASIPQDYARARLDDMVERAAGGAALTCEALDALGDHDRKLLQATCAMLLRAGKFRHRSPGFLREIEAGEERENGSGPDRKPDGPDAGPDM